jgi:GNAT superfamily N-acetyltransferase
MIIRKFKEEDAVHVSEVIWKALDVSNSKDYGQDILLNMKNVYSSDNVSILSKSRTLLVAEDEGILVGVGGIENDFISSVFVNPDQQGKGIGRGIMKALEAIAKEKHQYVSLYSSLTAESFYASIDYRVVKRNTDPYYGENVLMRKMV